MSHVFWMASSVRISHICDILKLLGHEAIKMGNTILTWGSIFSKIFFSCFLRKWVTSTWTRWWTRHRVPSTSPCFSPSSEKDSRLVYQLTFSKHLVGSCYHSVNVIIVPIPKVIKKWLYNLNAWALQIL